MSFTTSSRKASRRFSPSEKRRRKSVSTEGNYQGKAFTDVDQLKQILASDVRPFARNLVIRIAEYAKRSRLVAADYGVVESIVDEIEKDGYRLKSMVIAMATSDLMKIR